MSRAFLLNTSVGEYRIVDFLGAGGMGEVYRAVHSKIGRVAAVKVLTQAAHSSGFVDRFFNEARIQASLQHPNIATLYDFLEFNGQPCIIMEYVDGPTLADRIRHSGLLSLAETTHIFQAVVEAIGYIHNHGIVHRDIKSNNIKISSIGQVKLLDFGIAKGRMSPGLTATGNVIGTLEYISPEQLRGGFADARSDIWSLGVLLYEMVTGRVPFEATTLGDLCDKIGRAAYAPPTEVNPALPREVANVISRCLKKNPADRYQSAAELLQDIKRLNALLPQPSLTTGTEGTSWAKKNWMMLTAGASAAAVVLLFALVAGLYWAMSDGSSVAPPVNEETARSDNSQSNASDQGTPSTDAQTRITQIHILEGRAEIYRDGKLIGTTPYDLKARLGERVNLTLKREGFVDEPLNFAVSDNKRVYTMTMKLMEK